MTRSRAIPLAAGAVSILALGLVFIHNFKPRLVWNASASAPIGLYRIEDRAIRIGDFALLASEESLENFISGRGYLPPEIPLIKRVAALPGAEICRRGEAVFIDNVHVANALQTDSLGREMPRWSGCFTLRPDEVFLLNSPDRSLDGRYFGVTKMRQVIGVAVPGLIVRSVD